MTTRWSAVRAWRDALAADHAQAPTGGLSPAGRDLALALSLDALHDEALDTVACMPGLPFPDATVVAARTVSTASLEWLAVLLGRGTRVVLKHPNGVPGLTPWLVAHARALDLPLTATDDRAAVTRPPLVVVMGDDATIADVRRAAAPGARVLGFGHRFSVVWWDRHADPRRAAEALALDVAAHDTRGCMSPALVLTDDADAVLAHLPDALEEAEARWPRGHVTASEHAAIRTRDALAAAAGHLIRGDAWRIHRLPASHVAPVALPRSVQVIAVAAPPLAVDVIAPWREVLSSQATLAEGIDGSLVAGPDLGAPRTTVLGALQAPALVRHHDGVDHLRAMFDSP